MSTKKNLFGGAGPNSLYTPMSEIEQEVLARLVEQKDLRVHVLGWATIENPVAVFGDLRLGLRFRLQFERPEFPTPVPFFDLELRTGSGLLLYKERQSTLYNGRALEVAAGVYIDLAWDIAIQAMDPQVVKELMPGTVGLTSRFQDKDTGEITALGNNKFSQSQREALARLRKGEALARKLTQQQVLLAQRK